MFVHGYPCGLAGALVIPHVGIVWFQKKRRKKEYGRIVGCLSVLHHAASYLTHILCGGHLISGSSYLPNEVRPVVVTLIHN